eukprot:COSAG01_NODE_523_length_15948_cov_161.993690_17_plen_178_part_00
MGRPMMCPRMIVFLAAAGIGRSVAKVLARDYGYDVFAGVRKTKDMDSIKAEGIQGLHPLILDVTKPAQVTAAVAEVKKLGKPLVALVNVSDHHYAPYLLLFSLPRASLVFVSRAVMGTCTPPRAECRHRGQPAGGDLVAAELSQRLRSQPLCKHTTHTRMECPDRRRHITTPPRSVM